MLTALSLLLTFVMIFFQLHGSHWILHSFPTRRSSDLALAQFGRAKLGRLHGSLGGGVPRHRGCRRSEEHTSELQSLRHLVCRLLLEKKKILEEILSFRMQVVEFDNVNMYVDCDKTASD